LLGDHPVEPDKESQVAIKKTFLGEEFLPTRWYNLNADFPEPMPPPLHPGTGNPPGPEDFAPIFPMNLVEQEMTPDRWVDIPEEILGVYKIWRPTPLYRADRLEAALNAPVKIYFKNEGVSPPGSHKPNTAVAQAYYNKAFGVKRLTTETGAGQWGSALAFACNYFDLECKVYMVRVSFEQKPYRRIMMMTWGADCVPSPTDTTEAGRKILAQNPDSPGSLGIAISEAIEDCVSTPGTKYTLGSVLNHVLLHQTVVGLEAKKQFEKVGEYPDMIFAPCGGGSNFGGAAFPFLADKAAGDKRASNLRCIAVEPASCPTLTKGVYAYDHGDASGHTPLMKMYTLGHDFMPPGIHAGGLRYHGDSPLVSQLLHEGHIEAVAAPQVATFEAGLMFARAEGVIPAPESCHAIRACIDEAQRCKESGEPKTLFFNLSGHGHFDMTAYGSFLDGKLEDFEYPAEAIAASLAGLSGVGA